MSDPYGAPLEPPLNAPSGAGPGIGVQPGNSPAIVVAQQVVVIGGPSNSGVFVYSGPPALGNLIASITAVSGTDPYGNQFPAGINGLLAPGIVTAGAIAPGALDNQTMNLDTINNATIVGANIEVSAGSGGIFIYATGGTTVQTFTSNFNWTAPQNVTAVDVELTGGGAGGGGNGGAQFLISGGAGGGGQYVKYAGHAVIPGNVYAGVIGLAGPGGSGAGVNGTDGGASTFDAGTLSAAGGLHGQSGNTGAHGGNGGNAAPPGSPTDTENGGPGGNGVSGGPAGGGGGGSSGGPGNPGNAGGNGRAVPNSGYGAGGGAVPGGGPGARGGGAKTSPFNGQVPTVGPGGGGGGAGGDGGGSRAGGAGFKGQVKLTYTPSAPVLVASLTGGATTDPVGGLSVPVGLGIFNQSPAPAAVAGAATVYAAGGQMKYVAGATGDGSAYNTGVLTLTYTGAGQLVNSTSTATIGTISAPLAIGTYVIRGRVHGLQGATAARQACRLIASGGLVASLVDTFSISTNFGNTANTNYASSAAFNTDFCDTGATLMSINFTWSFEFNGLIVVTTAGTLSLAARCVTLSTDTWTVEAGTYMQVIPVT